MTSGSNIEALTLGDIEIFENARGAIAMLKKTFETWTVVGRAVVRARKIANDRGGRQTFQRLLDREGISKIITQKATISRLEAIMENLTEVTAWHETLTDKQQAEWAAPGAVFKHCPLFAKPKAQRIGPTPQEALKIANQELQQQNHQLETKLAGQRGGDLFKPGDKAGDIAVVLIGMLTPNKIEELIRELKKRQPQGVPSTPKLPRVKLRGRQVRAAAGSAD